jgi:transposase-like protein
VNDDCRRAVEVREDVAVMTYSKAPRCPTCRGEAVEQVSRTLAGRRYECARCGERWGVSLEDEILDMLRRPAKPSSPTDPSSCL